FLSRFRRETPPLPFLIYTRRREPHCAPFSAALTPAASRDVLARGAQGVYSSVAATRRRAMCLDPISRRRFLQLTAATAPARAAPAATAAPPSTAQAQPAAPARPQDQMAAGMIDFHVHTYPDNFERTVSAVEAAQGARERGLKAIVLKGGAFETVTRAAQANE